MRSLRCEFYVLLTFYVGHLLLDLPHPCFIQSIKTQSKTKRGLHNIIFDSIDLQLALETISMALNKFNMTTERKLLMTVKGSLLLKVTFQFY